METKSHYPPLLMLGSNSDGWVNLENLVLVDPDDQYNKTATFQILGNAKVDAEFSRIPINLDIEFISLDKK